jgi:hypothetical protein
LRAGAIARYSPRVNPDIEDAIAKWLPEFGLPPAPSAGEKDLRGHTIRMASFADEDACRFFFPRRTLNFQRRMAKALLRKFASRGAKVRMVPVGAELYARWLDANGKADTPEVRFQFATRPPE